MPTLLHSLSTLFLQATQAAFPNAHITSDQIEVTPNTQPKLGDFQCNSAMKLAKPLQQKPREIADAIVQQLNTLPQAERDLIAHCDIAGPGFINIKLNAAALARRSQNMLQDARLGVAAVANHPRLVIDFSSPNTAKEMHVGHLRSTIIGDCLARVFEFLDYDVLRLNHIGDWGTAFGMLIVHMSDVAQAVLQQRENTDLPTLMTWYRQSKQRFDEDADFRKRAQQAVVALQSGDPQTLAAWKIICEISRQAYQQIYDLLAVRITERGESFYNPLLPSLVADLEHKGLITVSDGAKCIFLEGFSNREGQPLPLMVQKSDGGFNYDTTDLAAMRHRIEVEHAKRIIILTDAGQSTHFQMIEQAAERAGYLNPSAVQFNHVAFGLVLGANGKKFKTRSGDTERLLDLLTTAIDHARTLLAQRDTQIAPAELEHAARVLGINAVKYADLSTHRISDYHFSYERMLRFDGNTAAFVMYAYVRVQSIKRKLGVDLTALAQRTQITLNHPSEHALALHLNRFDETLLKVSAELFPHVLAEYLYTTAELFNAFFRDCRVEGDPAQDSRLLLCELTSRVLQKGMELLGLTIIERM